MWSEGGYYGCTTAVHILVEGLLRQGGGLRPNSIQFKLRMMVSKCRRIALSSLCAVILSSVAAAFLPVKHTVLEPHGRPFSALHSIPADGKPCSKIEVCWSSSSKDCKRRGSKKTYDLFMELGTGLEGVEIVAADCMDECTSGPNVRFDDDDRRILGGVRGPAKVAAILGVDVPEPEGETKA